MTSKEAQIAGAWRRLAESFAARKGPLVRTTEAIGSEELRAAWSRCVATVQSRFAAHHGQKEIDERFRLPEDYAAFMQIIGGGWKWPYELEWTLFDADAVAARTEADFESFVSGVEEGEPVLDSGFWLSIGWWSDKHEYLLCCDLTHEYFGAVVDGHDSHPWLNGARFGGCQRVASSFLQWLEKY